MPRIRNAKLDLASATILLVGDRPGEQDILAQMLMGFGVAAIQRSASAEDALELAATVRYDLALIDAGLKGMDGYALVKQIRRRPEDSIKHLPIVVICGHVRRSDLVNARDCGTNFVLTKPISPKRLFDRIMWLAQEERQFVESESYVGPDRRFKAFGPPMGMKGRRGDDLSAHVGQPSGENLSQTDVDDFFAPKKVSL